MTWLRIDLSQRQLEEGAVGRIREECFRWHRAAQTPEDACLLSRMPDPKRRSRVALELYVSPTMGPICRDAIDA